MQPGQAGSQVYGEDWMVRKIQNLERQVQQLAAANLLRTAGIGTFDGGIIVEGAIQSRREDGTVGASMDAGGSVTAYAADGVTKVARFGPLDNSAPGEYGVEVLIGGTWVQIGAQVATWANLAGKPTEYPPSAHQHTGGDITSAVAAATNAAEAAHAEDADGSSRAFNNNVAGTQFYAVWVGNDPGNSLGRNTSSIRYKENVRDYSVDPQEVLKLCPVVFDRKAQFRSPKVGIGPENMIPGAKNEYGLIAEETNVHVPEIVVWFDGQIDNVRFDLLALALLDVVKDQDRRIKKLEGS